MDLIGLLKKNNKKTASTFLICWECFCLKQTAEERCLIVLIGSSRPCSVCLGLGEAKRCYCLEVSNPTRNKEDGRNVLHSPISALQTPLAHAHKHTYMQYCCAYIPYMRLSQTCTHTRTRLYYTWSHEQRRSIAHPSTLRHTNTFSTNTRMCTLFDKQPETDKIITTFKLTFSSTQMPFSEIN